MPTESSAPNPPEVVEMTQDKEIQQETNNMNNSDASPGASSEAAVNELESSPAKKPVSGDVAAMLREMQGGSGPEYDEMKQNFLANVAIIKNLINDLPPGSRIATPEEASERALPQGATPVLVPEGMTISRATLERCVKHGLFPIPPRGAKIIELINPDDRESMISNQAAQMQALKERHQHLSSMNQHLLNGSLPSSEGMKSTMDMDNFPVGPNGLRVPAEDEFDAKTVRVYGPGQFENELKQSLEASSFLEAVKWLVIGGSVCFWITFMSIYLLWNSTLYLVASLCTIGGIWYFYTSTWVRRKAAGYKCPAEYLEISQENKIAVVAGGSSGVGAEIVKQLYRMGISKIFVLEKSYMMALNDLDEMKKSLHSEDIDTSEWSSVVEAVSCDMSNLKEIFEFTKSMAAKKLPVHYLVLHSSDFSMTEPSESEVDYHFMSNYLGQFLLAKQLFIPINHTGGRVISTSTQMYGLAKALDVHQNVLDLSNIPTRLNSYVSSKALRILFTKMLAQRMNTLGRRDPQTGAMSPSNAIAVSFNPGIVVDRVFKKLIHEINPWMGPIILWLIKPMTKTPIDAAQTVFKLLFAPGEALKSGGYYNEGTFMKTYGACNVTFEEVKSNIVKLWQISNIMIFDHSFESQLGNNMAARNPSVTQGIPQSITQESSPIDSPMSS